MYAWKTFGGYRLRWLTSVVEIPRFARGPLLLSKLQEINRKLQSFFSRLILSVMTAYLWGQMLYSAIRNVDLCGGNWSDYLQWLTFLGFTLGVWVITKIGIKQENPFLTACIHYGTYLISRLIYGNVFFSNAMIVFVALTDNTISTEMKSTSEGKHSFWRRTANLLYFALMCTCVWLDYLKGIIKDITNNNSDGIPRYEAIYQTITNFRWADFKQFLSMICHWFLYDVGEYIQHHGWYGIWKEIIDSLDPNSEINAYIVLGVNPMSSQREITSKWRALIKKHHPDKCRDPCNIRDAHTKFIKIQHAFEVLSKIKNKRMQKNIS